MLKAFILMAPQTSGLIINQFFLQILNIFKPIMPGVHKMVKYMLKAFQNLVEDFSVCLTILWTPGIMGLKIFKICKKN